MTHAYQKKPEPTRAERHAGWINDLLNPGWVVRHSGRRITEGEDRFVKLLKIWMVGGRDLTEKQLETLKKIYKKYWIYGGKDGGGRTSQGYFDGEE